VFKNTAAKFMVFAWDTTTGVAKTGDAANITAYVSKDYGTVTILGDTAATEMDATNAPGYYLFDAAQAETNADVLMVSATSATANIAVIGAPAIIYTRPTTGFLAPTTLGRTLDVSAGGEAGVDWANVGSPTTAVNLSGTNIDVDQVIASVSGAVGSVTGLTAATVHSDLDDIQARLPAALTAGGNIKADALLLNGATPNNIAATDIVSAGAITTLSGAVVNVDLVDTCTTNTDMRGTDSAALASVCTEGRLAELDAANLPADVDAILADTNELQTDNIPGTLTTIAAYIDTEVAAILADTNELQTDWADGGRLDLILDARASQTSVDAIDGIVDNILLDTAEIGAAGAGLTALATQTSVDTVDANVDLILADTGTDGVVVAAASKTGYRLSATGVDDILDEAVEGTRTLRQILRGYSSALLAKLSGGGTATETFRDIDDSKDRITATVDEDGNRTAITLDLT